MALIGQEVLTLQQSGHKTFVPLHQIRNVRTFYILHTQTSDWLFFEYVYDWLFFEYVYKSRTQKSERSDFTVIKILSKGFEDTKGVIRIRISKKNRQHNI